jgi:hypothetical protein
MLNVYLAEFQLSAMVTLGCVVSCHELYIWQATHHCVCCVLLWNNVVEEFQGHTDCHSSFDRFLNVDHSISTPIPFLLYKETIVSWQRNIAWKKVELTPASKFSVMWRNHCVSCACSQHFSVYSVQWSNLTALLTLAQSLPSYCKNCDCTILQ